MTAWIIEELIEPGGPAAFPGRHPVLGRSVSDDGISIQADLRDQWLPGIKGKLGSPGSGRLVRPAHGQRFSSRRDSHRTIPHTGNIGRYDCGKAKSEKNRY